MRASGHLSEGVEEPVEGDLNAKEDEEAAEEVGGYVLHHADGHQKQRQLHTCRTICSANDPLTAPKCFVAEMQNCIASQE